MDALIRRILANLSGLEQDRQGRSSAQVFRAENAFLKIGARGTLLRASILQSWFASAGFAAPLLAFDQDAKRDYLLVGAMSGRAGVEYLDRPEWLAERLGEGMRRLHETDASDCPLSDVNECAAALYARETGRSLDVSALQKDAPVHGDCCLPNVFLDDQGLCGFIDLGEGGVGDRHFDLYWASWSLEYNLKTAAYTSRMLDAYGRNAIDEDRLNLCARLSRCAD